MTTREADSGVPQAVLQLKEYIESVIAANDRRYSLRDDFQKEAVRVALAANERRLDSMNEFRAALSDQTARSITREEFEIIRQNIADKAEETTKATNTRIDSEVGPLHTKMDEIGRPNWTLLASLISISFVLIAGIWLVIGLKIDSSLVPVSLTVEDMKVAAATVAEVTKNNTEAVAAATQSTLVSRVDRAQLNSRVQVIEEQVATAQSDRRAAEARTSARLVEIETQFKSASVVANIQKDDTERLIGLLWNKVFPGSTLPPADYRPKLYQAN